MSWLDHVLITPNLLHAVQSIEHVKVDRQVSDHAAVVMHLDRSNSNVGKGVFQCEPNTHKYSNYQKSIRTVFTTGLIDFIDDKATAVYLR